MSAIRYTGQLRANVVSVKNDIILGGNIHYDDGSLLSLDTVGNIVGNIGDINTVGNVGNIGSIDTILDVNNIQYVENATQHTESIGNITAEEALIGDVETITYMNSGSASIAGNIGNIIDMSGTIANLHGGVGSIGNVPGTIEYIDGNLTANTVGNIGDVNTIENDTTGNINSIVTANIENASNVGSVGNINNVTSIGTVSQVDGNVDIENYNGNINNTSGVYINQGMEPGYPLAVTGDAKIDGNLDVSKNGTFLGRLAVGSNDVSDADVPLHVTASHGGYPLVTFENTYSDTTDGSIGLELKNSTQEFQIGAHKPTGLQFRAGGDTRMTMLADGNLGIGTDAPTARLDVDGTTRLRGDVTSDGVITTTEVNVMNGTTTVPSIATMSYFSGTGNNARVVIDNTAGGNAALRLRSIKADGDVNADFGLAVNANGTAGIYRYDGDHSGSYAFLIDDTGNVGIGTTSPTAKLDVRGNINVTSNLDVGGNINLTSNLDVSGDAIVHGNIDSRQNLYVTSNVGIGNTSPTAKLDVDGTTRLRGAVTMDSTLNVGGNTSIRRLGVGPGNVQASGECVLRVRDDTLTTTKLCVVNNNPEASSAGASLDLVTPDASYALAVRDCGLTVYDFAASTHRLRMIPNGNLGIGTTSPAAKLDVDGTTRLRGDVTTDSNLTVNDRITSYSNRDPVALFQANSSSTRRFLVENVGGGGAMYRLRTSKETETGTETTHDWGISTRANSPGTLVFYNYDTSSHKLVMTSNGFVGIGNVGGTSPAMPTTNLDVFGDARIRGDVTSNGVITTTEVNVMNGTTTVPSIATMSYFSGTGNNARVVIDNTAGGNAALRLRSVDTNDNDNVKADFGLAVNGDGSAGIYRYTSASSGSYALLIDGTGNVGIGTQTPTARLDVNGSINSRQNLYVTSNVGIGTTSPTAKLDVRGNINTTGNLDVSGNIKSTGSVGIGVTTPTAKLDVNGNIKSTGNLDVGGSINATGNLDVSGDAIVHGNIDSRQNLYVTSNVGIGTTSPTAKLDVDGDTRIRGDLVVDGAISSGSWLSMDTMDAVVRSFSKNVYRYDGKDDVTHIDMGYGGNSVTLRQKRTRTGSMSIVIPNRDNAVSIRLLCTNALFFTGFGINTNINNRCIVDIPIRDATQTLGDTLILRWERPLNRYRSDGSGNYLQVYAIVTATMKNLTITGGTIDYDITTETWYDDLSGDTGSTTVVLYNTAGGGGGTVNNPVYHIYHYNIGQADAIVEYMT